MKTTFGWLCLLALFSFLFPQSCHGQAQPFHKKLLFAEHLTSLEYYDEAILQLQRMQRDHPVAGQQDTLNFQLAWNHYLNQQLSLSSAYFKNVGLSSPLYTQSCFFRSLSHCYNGEDSLAVAALGSVTQQDSSTLGLVHFSHAAMALLRQDFSTFDSLSTRFDGQHYAYAKEEQELLKLRTQFSRVRRRSPLLAGAMSSVLPGSGKIYAGKTAEGLVAFLLNGILAAGTWEQYRHGGLNNPQFYVLGSLFTIFYVGNVYGSVFSVKISRDEQLGSLNDKVLFNLHLPLRTFFR